MATSIPPSKKKQPVKPVATKPISDLRRPNNKNVAELTNFLSAKEDEIRHLKQLLAGTTDKYEAVKERLSELNNQHGKIVDEPKREYSVVKESLPPLAPELISKFEDQIHIAHNQIDQIDNQCWRIIDFQNAPPKGDAVPEPNKDFAGQVRFNINKLEVVNERLKRIILHLEKIV